jgi:hypothetical protein
LVWLADGCGHSSLRSWPWSSSPQYRPQHSFARQLWTVSLPSLRSPGGSTLWMIFFPPGTPQPIPQHPVWCPVPPPWGLWVEL